MNQDYFSKLLGTRMNYGSFLVINPYGIGDVLFTTPLLRNLREAYPGAKIYFLCSERALPVLKENPLIDKIFIYNRDAFVEAQKESKRKWVMKWLSFIWSIRREKIDVAFDLSLNSLFGGLALCAGIPIRVGLNYKKRGRFLNRKIDILGYDTKHVVEYQLDLIRLLGIPCRSRKMEVYTGNESRIFAADFLASHGVTGPKIVGIAPCGGEAFGQDAHRKKWPLEKYAELINGMIEKRDVRILLFASKREKDELLSLLKLIDCPEKCVCVAECTLEQVTALIEKTDLFIANDTGLLRIANAFDKKLIALFGPVDINVYSTYPFEPSKHVILTHDIHCRPCYKRFRLQECHEDYACIKDISVTKVMAAVERLINS
jgi:heptosyltransferase II